MSVISKAYVGMWKFVDIGDTKRIAGQTKTPGVFEENDIFYINDNNEYHLLDVYYPENTKDKLPVIFDIHGGGWVYGTKRINKYYCIYMASLGYTVVNINYRLAPDATITEQLKDVFAALSWTKDNIKDHHGDINRLYVTGDSAGGHLASLVGALMYNDKLKAEIGFSDFFVDIKALGLTSPASELLRPTIMSIPGKATLLGVTDEEKQLNEKYLSFKKVFNKKIPPCFIQVGQIDIVRDSVRVLKKVLTKSKIDFEIHDWKGEKSEQPLMHVFSVTNPEYKESEIAIKEMLDYFSKY